MPHAGADGECPDYGSRYDPCPPSCASGECVYAYKPPDDDGDDDDGDDDEIVTDPGSFDGGYGQGSYFQHAMRHD